MFPLWTYQYHKIMCWCSQIRFQLAFVGWYGSSKSTYRSPFVCVPGWTPLLLMPPSGLSSHEPQAKWLGNIDLSNLISTTPTPDMPIHFGYNQYRVQILQGIFKWVQTGHNGTVNTCILAMFCMCWSCQTIVWIKHVFQIPMTVFSNGLEQAQIFIGTIEFLIVFL